MSASKAEQCAMCETPLNREGIKEITTACGHTFHRECVQKRLDRYNKTNCKICGKEGALADALQNNKVIMRNTGATQNYGHNKSFRKVSHLVIPIMII